MDLSIVSSLTISPISTFRVIGLNRAAMTTHWEWNGHAPPRIPHRRAENHDAAAVLVADGRVICGIEEERLNRIKHSSRMPAHALRACLRMAALPPSAIDKFAFFVREDLADQAVATHLVEQRQPHWTARAYYACLLSDVLGHDIAEDRIAFVEHHQAHAISAYTMGPFPEALVVTLDGAGDLLSGTISIGVDGALRRLREIGLGDSLGLFYLHAIRLLGYSLFDEYKVMGLAPYGDPARFRDVFSSVCELQPEGRFSLNMWKLWDLLPVIREAGPAEHGPPEVHRDIAAALQEALERAVFHLLAHYRQATGLRYLCLAGGVAHNSTLNGKIARSGLFDGVFVQPAAHDAGCALGAALVVHQQCARDVRIHAAPDVYWGQDIGDESMIAARLDAWASCVKARRAGDAAGETARLLAEGEIVGWVQGRAEFGPRALGNRSLLADPRSIAMKDRINRLVKERESYRPFAPAVLEEYAQDFFELTPGTDLGYMTFTVPVRHEMRERLGAVTHVDGTARVQTVSRERNRRFWDVLEAFRRLTQVPVLLNTSFNHRVEPIVDSIDDALTCLLTTTLSHVTIGDFIVSKRGPLTACVVDLAPGLPLHVRLTRSRHTDADGRLMDVYACESVDDAFAPATMRAETYEVLEQLDGTRTLGDLLSNVGRSTHESIVDECARLWCRRLLTFAPPSVRSREQMRDSRSGVSSVAMTNI